MAFYRCFLPFQMLLLATFAIYGTVRWALTGEPPIAAYVQLIHPLIVFAGIVTFLFIAAIAFASQSFFLLPVVLASAAAVTSLFAARAYIVSLRNRVPSSELYRAGRRHPTPETWWEFWRG